MKKVYLTASLFFFIFTNPILSNENDIYKKIDLFSEVLDKINKEYVDEVNQSEVMDAAINGVCLLYTSPSPRDSRRSRMPSSA